MSSGQKKPAQSSSFQQDAPAEVNAVAKTAAKPHLKAKKPQRPSARTKIEQKTTGAAGKPGSQPDSQNVVNGTVKPPEIQETEEPGTALGAAEWNEIEIEDPTEILEDPAIALELTEDPVRLYLKEIGQINLLDADAEFRLAARIEACVRVNSLRQHVRPSPGKERHYRALFNALLLELTTS